MRIRLEVRQSVYKYLDALGLLFGVLGCQQLVRFHYIRKAVIMEGVGNLHGVSYPIVSVGGKSRVTVVAP